MIDDSKNILNIDAFTKWRKVAQDSSNFKSHKTSFLCSLLFFFQQKKRHIQYQHELTLSVYRCQPLIIEFFIMTSSKADPSILLLLFSQALTTSPPILEQSNFNLIKYTFFKAKLYQKCLNIIHKLKQKIASKKTTLQGQDLAQHQAILSFLKVQIWKPENFSLLWEDYIYLTFCLINPFKTRIGFLMKIKNYVNTILSYLNIIKIITGIETKWRTR